MIESTVLSEAAQLNQVPSMFENFDGINFTIPFILDSENIILEVIKKAEKEQALILRLYEPKGKDDAVNLKFKKTDVSLFETDLLENNLKELEIKRNCVTLKFAPFEIKTIKIKGI